MFLCLGCVTACGCYLPTKTNGDSAEPIGLTRRGNIKVVYQIKTDEQKNGLGAGLYYVSKLVDAYDRLGIDPSDRQIHAVFHGDAGHWMLTDAAYVNVTGTASNPNKDVIQHLIHEGVHLELCASTMKNNGWEKPDVIDGVTIVIGAYPRLIDLQLQGLAYIRF